MKFWVSGNEYLQCFYVWLLRSFLKKATAAMSLVRGVAPLVLSTNSLRLEDLL